MPPLVSFPVVSRQQTARYIAESDAFFHIHPDTGRPWPFPFATVTVDCTRGVAVLELPYHPEGPHEFAAIGFRKIADRMDELCKQ